ncbi:MAG: hypothetical protein JW892_00020 [Anaerolineae bacterium]|nr:hypothetical protein [Anaerolineae bacterium]
MMGIGLNSQHLYQIDQAPTVTHWQTYYAERVGAQLVWALDYVQQHQNHPQELKTHGRSVFSLLEQARRYPQWYERMVAVLVALEHKPARWGEWGQWEALLKFCLNITASRSDLSVEHLSLLDEWAQLCFATGRLAQAQEITLQILQQAPLLLTAEVLTLARALDLFLDILISQNRLVEAAEWLTRAENWFTPTAPRARAYWHMGQGKLARRQRLFTVAQNEILEALKILEQLPQDPEQLGAAYNLLGIIHWNKEEFPAAVETLQQAAHWYMTAGNLVTATSIQGNLGLVYWGMQKFRWAEISVRRAIAISETLGARWRLMIDLETLGATYLACGKAHLALECFDKQLQMATQLEDRLTHYRAHGNRGLALTALSCYSEGLQELEFELQFSHVHGSELGMLCNAMTRVRCLAKLNRETEAEALAREVLIRAHAIGHQGAIIAALRCLAQQVPKEQRAALLQEALNLAQQRRSKLDEAACWLLLAEITTGQEQRAYWRRGKRLLKEIGASAWLDGYTPSSPPYILGLL